MIEIIFWSAIGLILYCYLGYPLLIILLSQVRKKQVKKADIQPTISLIISAYNEEAVIKEKIENSLALQYDKNKLEIIVASDCSNDKTDEIATSYRDQGVRLVRLAKRGGKTAVQNLAVEQARGEILVFSDATTMYRKDALQKIVRSFKDEEVGCVGGQLLFIQDKNANLGLEKNLTMKYDQFIKQKESQIQTIFGVNGCFYAVRKELYDPLDDNLTSDFVVPLKIIDKGYRVIYEPEAVCFEETSKSITAEFKRKIRTVRAGMKGCLSMMQLLNPLKSPFVFWGLSSHKLLRWFVPYLSIMAFVSNVILSPRSTFYSICLLFQILIYAFALIGYLIRKKCKIKILTAPLTFAMLNLAAILGLGELIKHRKGEIWEPIR